MAKIEIFVALEEELESILEVFESKGKIQNRSWKGRLSSGHNRFKFVPKGYDDVADDISVNLIRGMGNVMAAAHVGTSFVPPEAGGDVVPQLVILVGISGSLSEGEARLEDVVVSNHVKYYAPDKILSSLGKKTIRLDSNKRSHFNGKSAKEIRDALDLPNSGIAYDVRDRVLGGNILRFKRDNIFYRDRDARLESFMAWSDKKLDLPYRVKHGTILGTDWVIDSQSYVEYLADKEVNQEFDYYAINKPDEFADRCKWNEDAPIAADMETYGFFLALERLAMNSSVRPLAFAVRGISDLCSGKSDLDDRTGGQHRKKAAQNAAEVALNLVAFKIAGWTHTVPLSSGSV